MLECLCDYSSHMSTHALSELLRDVRDSLAVGFKKIVCESVAPGQALLRVSTRVICVHSVSLVFSSQAWGSRFVHQVQLSL